jgi:hypothetical protein
VILPFVLLVILDLFKELDLYWKKLMNYVLKLNYKPEKLMKLLLNQAPKKKRIPYLEELLVLPLLIILILKTLIL